MDNDSFKELCFKIFFPFFVVLSLIFCCYLFAFTSHASDVSNGDLPYNVPDFRGANNVIPDLAIEMARDKAIDTIQNYYGYTGDVSFIMFTNDGIINNYIYDVMVIPMPSINYNIASTSNFRENAYFVTANYVPMFRVGVLLNFDHTERNLNAGNGANLLGVSATSELNGETFTPRYPFYIYGVDEITATNGTVIFTNNEPIVPIVTGHATEPDPIDEPIFPTGHARPNQVPTLTINNYTWTTPPTPDLSTLENTAGSIYNYLSWLGSNLIGALGNIVTNIQNVGNFLAETLQYYLGLIIDAIKNSINTFYNNMVSLFEPIASAISYITSPIDSTVINAAFTSTNFYGVKSQFTNTFTTFDNAFDISEPDSFTLIFNVQNITLFYDFGVRSPVTVDLGANFIPIRQALRTFLWVLVSFGSVFVVEHGLANWLRGERNT